MTFLGERFIANQAARIVAMAAFLAFPGVQYAALTFRMPSLPGTVYSGGWLVLSKHLGWAHPPDDQGNWGQARIVDAVRTMIPAEAAQVNVVVGVEHPYFNSNILNYLDACDDGPLRFHSFGFDPDSPPDQALENALARIRDLDPAVIVPYLNVAGLASVRTDAAETSQFADNPGLAQLMTDWGPLAQGPHPHPQSLSMVTVAEPYVESVYLDQSDAQSALDQAAGEISALL